MSISDIADLATAAGVITALITFRIQCARENRRATFAYYEDKERTLKEDREALKKKYSEYLSEEEAARLDADVEDRKRVRRILNIYDRLATGVNTGILCLETIDRVCGRLLVETYKRYQTYIERRQREHGALIWADFVILVRKIKKRRKLV